MKRRTLIALALWLSAPFWSIPLGLLGYFISDAMGLMTPERAAGIYSNASGYCMGSVWGWWQFGGGKS